MDFNKIKEMGLEYAEKGAREEPDYPWVWLQVGKLRAHFGDKAGALEAVERGNTVLVAKEGCLDENGVIKDLSAAEERQVTLGRNDDEYIEIVDGLEEGEVVLALSPQGSSLMSAMGMG